VSLKKDRSVTTQLGIYRVNFYTCACHFRCAQYRPTSCRYLELGQTPLICGWAFWNIINFLGFKFEHQYICDCSIRVAAVSEHQRGVIPNIRLSKLGGVVIHHLLQNLVWVICCSVYCSYSSLPQPIWGWVWLHLSCLRMGVALCQSCQAFASPYSNGPAMTV